MRDIEKQHCEAVGTDRLFGTLVRVHPAVGKFGAESLGARVRQSARHSRHFGEEHIEVARGRECLGEPFEFRFDARDSAVAHDF